MAAAFGTFPEAVISKDPLASVSLWETPAACLASPLDSHGIKAMSSSQRVGNSAVSIGKEKLIALFESSFIVSCCRVFIVLQTLKTVFHLQFYYFMTSQSLL